MIIKFLLFRHCDLSMESEHHSNVPRTNKFKVMRFFGERNRDRVQAVLKTLFERYHDYHPKKHGQPLDFSNELINCSEYSKLSKRDQQRYLVDFFRSPIGYAFIHELFESHRLDFNGKIDLLHNLEVKKLLQSLGINETLDQKRDWDFVNFLESIYFHIFSYYNKLTQDSRSHSLHLGEEEGAYFSYEEALSLHLVSGTMQSDDDFRRFRSITRKQDHHHHHH